MSVLEYSPAVAQSCGPPEAKAEGCRFAFSNGVEDGRDEAVRELERPRPERREARGPVSFEELSSS